MRSIALTLGLTLASALLAPAVATAKESGLLSSNGASAAKDDVRVLGRVNANTASRDELLQVPGLDPGKADEILEARKLGSLGSLERFSLPPEVQSRLSLEGSSTLRRIRALPLETFTAPAKSASR